MSDLNDGQVRYIDDGEVLFQLMKGNYEPLRESIRRSEESGWSRPATTWMKQAVSARLGELIRTDGGAPKSALRELNKVLGEFIEAAPSNPSLVLHLDTIREVARAAVTPQKAA